MISVAANAWPAAFRQITDAALAGNFPEAAAVHYRFATMIDLLFADGNPGGIKAVLSELGLIGNHLRLPLVPVREEIRKKISKEVKTAVVLEMIRGEKTVAQISKEYGIHENLAYRWKDLALTHIIHERI